MVVQLKTDFSPFLTTTRRDGYRERIIAGSEHLDTFPNQRGRMGWGGGMLTYGTQKVKGIRCLKVGVKDGRRAEPFGWKVVHQATSYAYIARAEPSEIDQERVKAMQDGRRIWERRRKDGLSISDAALSLGIAPIELNWAESGDVSDVAKLIRKAVIRGIVDIGGPWRLASLHGGRPDA